MSRVQKQLVLTLCLALTAALAGCGDRVQTASTQKKVDVAAYKGAAPAYTVGTWKAGDEASWEAQMRTRSQGQNEYSRSGSPP